MHTVEVTHPGLDDLTREVWRFDFNHTDARLVLDYYAQEARPTRRHKFRVQAHYYRLDTRGNTLERAEVPLPTVITDTAWHLFTRQIVVSKYWRASEEPPPAPPVDATARWQAAAQAPQEAAS